jgi:hypothetical protein
MVSHSSSVTSSLAMFSCYPVNGFVRLTKWGLGRQWWVAKIFGPAKPLPLRVAIASPSNNPWSCHNARACG